MTQATLDLTDKQQELLLRGLRFVRSSVSMECRDPSPEVEQDRQDHYEEIDRLETMISDRKLPQKG